MRISDTPKTSGTKTHTNSEAQLIGRGARYNPFILEGEKAISVDMRIRLSLVY